MRHIMLNHITQIMKNQSEISWQFPAHPPPQWLQNYNEQAKRISFQIAEACRAWAITLSWANEHMATPTHMSMG